MSFLAPPADGLVPTWQWLLATWFGSGLVDPLRAGLAVFTCLLLFIILARHGRHTTFIVGIILFAIGVYTASMIEIASAIKDDRRIVIDEASAFMIGASLLKSPSWLLLAVYAVVFLAIDKLKPWPFSHVEQWPSGWGVMADDLALALTLSAAFAGFLLWRRRNA